MVYSDVSYAFRVWDVLQEIINNDDLPEGYKIRFRAFYVNDYIVFVFWIDAQKLADFVLGKTIEEIRKYNSQNYLNEEDKERFKEILANPCPTKWEHKYC